MVTGMPENCCTVINTSILEAHRFNIIVNPLDIDNIIERCAAKYVACFVPSTTLADTVIIEVWSPLKSLVVRVD